MTLNTKEMKTYTFEIQEKTTYWQTGTVTVEAKNLKEAKAQCMKGDYDHTGDNEVILDTEGTILEREITAVI